MTTISQALELVREKFGTIRAEWYAALEKTVHSKNITVSDWNFLVEKLAVVSSDMDGFLKIFEAIAELDIPEYPTVPDMDVLDEMMFEKYGRGEPDSAYFFSEINWNLLQKFNRAYVQVYTSAGEACIAYNPDGNGTGVYALKAISQYGGASYTDENDTTYTTMTPRHPWMKKDDWYSKFSESLAPFEIPDPTWEDFEPIGTLVERRTDGHIRIPDNFSNVNSSVTPYLATPKRYVDAQIREVAPPEYPDKNNERKQSYVYTLVQGNPGRSTAKIGTNTAEGGTIAQRTPKGALRVSTLNDNDTDAHSLDSINRAYATAIKNDLAKVKAVADSALPKVTQGVDSNRYVYTTFLNNNTGEVQVGLVKTGANVPTLAAELNAQHIVRRRTNGSVSTAKLPDKDDDAVSKWYVDSNVESLTGLISSLTQRVLGLESEGLSYVIDGNTITITGIGDYTNTKLIIPSSIGNMPVRRINNNAFFNNTSIDSTVIPGSVSSVAPSAFAGCTNMRTLNLNEGLYLIGASAFLGCKSLNHLAIPSSVEIIGSCAFYDTLSLNGVVFKGTPNIIHEDVFEFSSCKSIYVPWSEGDVPGAPWGAYDATIYYNYTEEY